MRLPLLRPVAALAFGASLIAAAACSHTSSSTSTATVTVTVTPAASPTPGAAVIFVSPAGNDANPGTAPSLPVLTIPHAIALVTSNFGIGEVHAAGGEYDVNSVAVPPTAVLLVEGVSLLGGYSADFSTRNPVTNSSEIRDIAVTTTGSIAALDAPVIARGLISRDTVVDAFVLVGGTGIQPRGVFVYDGASPTFSNLTIQGGNGASTVGARVDTGSSPLFLSCLISGGIASTGGSADGIISTHSATEVVESTVDAGTGDIQSFGILTANGADLVLRSTISGGASQNSTGVRSDSPGLLFEDNVVNGGGGTTASTGIELEQVGIVRANTIDGGAGGTSSIGILEDVGGDTLDSNIVFTDKGTTQTCIEEIGAGIEPATLRNNDLFDCPSALYLDDGTTALLTTAGVNAILTQQSNGVLANIAINAALNVDSAFRPTASTPASVGLGGFNLLEVLPVDHDGNPFAVTPTIGAYQQQ